MLLGLLFTEEQEWILQQISNVFTAKDPDFFLRWRRLCQFTVKNENNIPQIFAILEKKKYLYKRCYDTC